MARWVPCGGGVYRDSRTGNFFERPTVDGRRTWRKLPALNLKLAREMLSARRTDQSRAEHGLARDPYLPEPQTVAALAKAYEAAGCPDRHNHPRQGIQLVQEQSRVKLLLPHFKALMASKIRAKHCMDYFAARKGSVRKGTHGGRAVDLELGTLRNILQWAVTQGMLDLNPLAGQRPRFRKKAVHHCRDFMPKDAAELHALAAHFFEAKKSEVLGWQLLLEAFTGCRTTEVLRLRWDASPGKAGHIDGQYLWLERAKGGVNPFTIIHPALDTLLKRLRAWRDKRRPKSPWFLPGLRAGGKDPVDSSSLTHALKIAGPLISKAHRTSHGLRAYYVTVRRSEGIPDAQIAAEIGDRTGASIIASTYGEVPPNWRGGNELGFMPEGLPAWGD